MATVVGVVEEGGGCGGGGAGERPRRASLDVPQLRIVQQEPLQICSRQGVSRWSQRRRGRRRRGLLGLELFSHSDQQLSQKALGVVKPSLRHLSCRPFKFQKDLHKLFSFTLCHFVCLQLDFFSFKFFSFLSRKEGGKAE